MLANKTSIISPSVTIGISTKVKELNRQGIEVTSLSIGEPDFFTPDKVKQAAIEAIHANKTKYDSASGLFELKQAIVDKLKRDNHVSYDLDEIVVTSGAKHAISNALLAILNPNDEVIIPKPYWTSYPEMVKLLNGTPVFVNTKEENSFKLQAAELKALISNKTKAVFITNPSNPTGAVYTKEELEPIVKMCIENQIYILADEIYEKITFDDDFTSIASLSEEAKNMTITINGLSKSASMTGWRLGYTATNKKLASAMSAIQGHLVSHPSTITQWAAVEAINNCEADTKHMVDTYHSRRNEVIQMFEDIEDLSIVRPDGAFYVFINISKLKAYIDTPDSFSLEVCNRLLDDYRLAIVPGIAFGLDDYVRITYAADMETIKTGIEKMKQFINDLKK
ncbi:pyridoxal phosphate-dependent aminotransferase [Acidaminobacter sp. JC074]|uniref:pyridoxal phosphate-dependent aminotransferase n=1 Tax=Acidaminobacter sp. JC074 TaxID=2530199 RepID=UPI001F10A927|nr:pyridoxal phosphate-dependent aminotransferase [Acidaminobacter sp. JC074]MCH4887377.1 pyridoxal phosphate-dependent aminotransferase [Acidaminobacter sp. JC074]